MEEDKLNELRKRRSFFKNSKSRRGLFEKMRGFRSLDEHIEHPEVCTSFYLTPKVSLKRMCYCTGIRMVCRQV